MFGLSLEFRNQTVYKTTVKLTSQSIKFLKYRFIDIWMRFVSKTIFSNSSNSLKKRSDTLLKTLTSVYLTT